MRMEAVGGTRIWKVLTMKKLAATTCGKEWAVPHLGALNGIRVAEASIPLFCALTFVFV